VVRRLSDIQDHPVKVWGGPWRRSRTASKSLARSSPGPRESPAEPVESELDAAGDVPRGQSMQAHVVILEVEQGAIDARWLTKARADAAAGLWAETKTRRPEALRSSVRRLGYASRAPDCPDPVKHGCPAEPDGSRS
jgi:hypothetical protein